MSVLELLHAVVKKVPGWSSGHGVSAYTMQRLITEQSPDVLRLWNEFRKEKPMSESSFSFFRFVKDRYGDAPVKDLFPEIPIRSDDDACELRTLLAGVPGYALGHGVSGYLVHKMICEKAPNLLPSWTDFRRLYPTSDSTFAFLRYLESHRKRSASQFTMNSRSGTTQDASQSVPIAAAHVIPVETLAQLEHRLSACRTVECISAEDRAALLSLPGPAGALDLDHVVRWYRHIASFTPNERAAFRHAPAASEEEEEDDEYIESESEGEGEGRIETYTGPKVAYLAIMRGDQPSECRTIEIPDDCTFGDVLDLFSTSIGTELSRIRILYMGRDLKERNRERYILPSGQGLLAYVS